MGMGEPLDNLDAVLPACDVLSDDCGFAVAPRADHSLHRRGRAEDPEFHRRARVRLAVSLHAANDEERRALLPVARTWDLAALREALREARDTVLLQWTLIAGVNDSDRHADELLAFCDGLDVRVNLIPLNPGPEDTLRAPSMSASGRFRSDSATRGSARWSACHTGRKSAAPVVSWPARCAIGRRRSPACRCSAAPARDDSAQ